MEVVGAGCPPKNCAGRIPEPCLRPWDAEMPAGYADKLMEVSPVWTFPVTLIATIAIAVITANISKKLLKIECN